MRKLLFYKPAACRFVCIEEFADLAFWMRTKKDMQMIRIMVPFKRCYLIRWSNVLEYFPKPDRNTIVNDIAPVFSNEYKMVEKCEYRMIIIL